MNEPLYIQEERQPTLLEEWRDPTFPLTYRRPIVWIANPIRRLAYALSPVPSGDSLDNAPYWVFRLASWCECHTPSDRLALFLDKHGIFYLPGRMINKFHVAHCRLTGHRGIVYYTASPYATEPDYHCKGCGELLG